MEMWTLLLGNLYRLILLIILFAEQVDVLTGVQQEVVPSATVILPERSQKIVDVKVILADLDCPAFQFVAVAVPHKLVERVEVGRDAAVSLDTVDVRRYRTAQLTRFRFGDFVILAFPESQEQCLDAVLFLHVIDKM